MPGTPPDEATLRALLPADRDAATAARWVAERRVLIPALFGQAEQAQDAELFRSLVTACELVLAGLDHDADPHGWAWAQAERANALRRLGTLTNDAGVLDASAAGFDAALSVWTLAAASLDHALALARRSSAISTLGELRADEALLRAALAGFDAALAVPGVTALGRDYNVAQSNRANTLRRLFAVTKDATWLKAAADGYAHAYDRATMPADWADAQQRRAGVLRTLEIVRSVPDLVAGAAGAEATAATAAGMAKLTQDFLAAPPAEMRRLLEQPNTPLLQPMAAAAIRGVAQRAAADGNSEMAGFFHALADLLKRWRENGVAAAFAQFEDGISRPDIPQAARPLLAELQGLQDDPRSEHDAGQLRRQVALCEQVLRLVPQSVDAGFWAAIQGTRANALQSLGALAGDAALLRQAVDGYDQALTVRTRTAMPADWATTHNNRASALARLGELAGDAAVLRQAVDGYEQALTVYTRDAMPAEWAATHNNRAAALQSLGRLAGDAEVLRRAVDGYEQALTVRTRDAMPADWAMTHNNRAGALVSLGELAGDAAVLRQAVDGYDQALTVRTRDAMPADWAATQNNRASALRSLAGLGDPTAADKAIAGYRAALAVMTTSGAEDTHQGSAGALARLLARQASYIEAAEVITQALARSDAALLDAGRSRDGHRRAIEQVEELYALLALCHHRSSQTEAGLAAADAGRLRLAVETQALSQQRARTLNDPEIPETVKAAQLRRDALRHRLGHGSEARDGAAPRAALTAEERTALDAELRAATDEVLTLHRQHGLMPVIEPLSAAQIIEAAPKDGALVLPVIAAGQTFAFVIAHGAVTVVEFKDADGAYRIDEQTLVRRAVNDEDSWLRTYYATLHDKRFRRDHDLYRDWTTYLHNTLTWLWDDLLGPLDAHLRDRKGAALQPGAEVVLVPPGLLGVLPLLGARPRPGAEPFGERWTVSLAPSVRTLLTCRTRAAAAAHRPHRLLGIFDPDGSLAGARLEAAVLRALFARAEQKPFIGDQATREAVLPWLDWASHFHGSTHGFHHPFDPTQSGIVLANKDMLCVSDLSAAQLERLRLVFLSACETGVAGVLKLSEEFIGLPTSFVLAGAAGVVASLWPVFDDASYLLSTRFYQELLGKDGSKPKTPAAALRAAQRWLRIVTYGELRTMFAEEDGWLLIGEPRCDDAVAQPDAERIEAAAKSARAPGGSATPEPDADPDDPPKPIRLRIGLERDCPYASPHEWAAFTATGA